MVVHLVIQLVLVLHFISFVCGVCVCVCVCVCVYVLVFIAFGDCCVSFTFFSCPSRVCFVSLSPLLWTWFWSLFLHSITRSFVGVVTLIWIVGSLCNCRGRYQTVEFFAPKLWHPLLDCWRQCQKSSCWRTTSLCSHAVVQSVCWTGGLVFCVRFGCGHVASHHRHLVRQSLCVPVYLFMCVYIYIYIYVCTYTHLYIYIYVYVYVYVYIYTYL